jgi:hypothetical protein
MKEKLTSLLVAAPLPSEEALLRVGFAFSLAFALLGLVALLWLAWEDNGWPGTPV